MSNWNSASNKVPGPGNITLLNDTCYQLQGMTIRENATSLVHIADIHSPATGARQVVIKAFPNLFARTGLENELVGYIVAREEGLPVATEAFIMVLPSELLFRCHPHFKSELSTSTGFNVVWATSVVNGPPLKYLHPLRDVALKRRLLKWPKLPDMLAFDDLIANEDRSEDNLICIANGELVLVDHADISGGISRKIEFLDPSFSPNNSFIRNLFDDRLPSSIKSGMVLAAERHPQVIKSALPHIFYWLNMLFPDVPDHTSKLMSYLASRANTSPHRIKQRHNLLI